MRMKSLPIIALLLALTVGNTNAQKVVEQPQTPRDGAWPTQDFEDEQMHGWTYQDSQGGSAGGAISTVDNHTTGGNYSFRITGSQKYRYLISPELNNTENGVNVSFFSTNHYGGTSELRVGYSKTTTNYSAFTWNDALAVSNVWQEYVDDLPAGVKYIAIAKPVGSSYLFVDDIVLSAANCAAPSINNDEVTKTNQSISVSWTGNSSSYELRYAPFNIYDFNNTNVGLGDWTPEPATNSWEWNPESDYSHSSAGSAISDVNVSQHDNYLISPSIPLGGSITFYAKGVCIEGSNPLKGQQSASEQYDFRVMVATVENPAVIDFIPIGDVIKASDGGWQKYTIDINVNNYTGTGRVAICHIYNANGRVDDEDEYKLAIDDIAIYYPWNYTTDPITTTNYTIENLVPDTYYAIQVKGGDCDKWSATCEVQTLPDDWSGTYEFVRDGIWNVPSNWDYGYMPPVGENVTISAAARIPSGCVASVGEITMSSNGSITISDGGQLKHSNTGVKAKMEKSITGYTGTNDHYQLIAFPSASGFAISDNNVYNLFNHYYYYTQYHEGEVRDFYYFDQSQELEWINYFVSATNLVPNPDPGFTMIYNGKGYLYARNDNATIVFNYTLAQSLKPSNADVQIPLAYTAGNTFAGWNLIGNPYACNAYFTDNRPFYRMEETAEGSKIVLATNNVIAPMEGVFVQATGANQQAVFTSTEPQQNNGDGLMDFTLRKANNRSTARIDRTRVVFGEGSNMGHLDLMADPNRLYIPLDGKAMSVVYSQPVGELPINFEAASDETFVLGFTNKAEDLAYCHLIDNLTGVDVDLLQHHEYTFNAKVSDYPSRFRVVFVAKDSEDIAEGSETFAFNSYGNWIIANEGLATLQVVDMQGRIISNETIEGCVSKTIHAVPGVYVLRLVNGENVKVQKIIIK